MARAFCAWAILCLICSGVFAGGTAAPAAAVFQDSAASGWPQNRIDQLVAAKHAEYGIVPAALCSDAVFVRRAYLDVIGTLPTAQEARDFLLDKDSRKRSK